MPWVPVVSGWKPEPIGSRPHQNRKTTSAAKVNDCEALASKTQAAEQTELTSQAERRLHWRELLLQNTYLDTFYDFLNLINPLGEWVCRTGLNAAETHESFLNAGAEPLATIYRGFSGNLGVLVSNTLEQQRALQAVTDATHEGIQKCRFKKCPRNA